MSLKVFVLFFIIRLYKVLLGRHAQVGARIEVDGSYVKIYDGPPLLEAFVS